MIFKCGCKSIVGHDSEGDATLTLEHSSNCKHVKEMIEEEKTVSETYKDLYETWFTQCQLFGREIKKLKEEVKTYNNLYKIAFKSSHKLGKDYQKLREKIKRLSEERDDAIKQREIAKWERDGKIEKLRAENVELAKAVRLLGKFARHQFDVRGGRVVFDKKLMMRANEAGAKALSSPSAKWVEAVEKLKDAIRELKKNTGDDWDSYWMEVEVAFDYLELIEEKQ